MTDRPRRQARLRDDDARPRAGHPPRQGGEQHLHEPGAARARRVASTSRRSGRTACATSRRSAPPGRPSSRPPSPRSACRAAPSRPVPQRVRGPRPGRARASIGGCSTAASSPASSWPTRCPTIPTLADGLLVCATEVTTSDEIARFAGALDDVAARPAADRRRGRGRRAVRATAAGAGSPAR